MRNYKKVLIVMLLVFCSISMLFAQSLAERKDIVIVYTNDVHCGYKGDIGYSGLDAYIKSLKASEDYVTVIDNGDAVQGEVIGTVSNGSYLVKIMNEIGYDYALFGNHEFDYGMDQLSKIVADSNAQYLCCNIDYTGNSVNKLALAKPYEIVSYGARKVAFIGVATPESLFKSTPKYFMEDGKYVYTFLAGQDLYNRVQYYVNEVRELGAEIVIVLSHLGVEEGSEPNRATDLIANTYGIDIVLDGHSHTVAPQELYANILGEPVLYSQTGTKLNNIGVLRIHGDEVSAELVQPKEKSASMDAFIAKIDEEYEAAVKQVVGTTDVVLDINVNGVRAVRNRETGIGNLCADAYRYVAGSDIGFSNGGGVRKTIKKGNITLQDIINVFPFGNKLCVCEATGQQIIDALEWGSQSTMKEAAANGKALGESGGFLNVSGLKYTIDTSIPTHVVKDDHGMFIGINGERRVKNVMVGSDKEGWKPIDLNKTYTLACHNYKLKDMGDGYTMFVNNKFIQDETMIDNQVLITYIRDFLGGKVTAAQYGAPEGRITVI